MLFQTGIIIIIIITVYIIGKRALHSTGEHLIAVYRFVVHLLCYSFVGNLKSSYQLMRYSVSKVT